MCTALSFRSGKHYFGRNLDLSYHYNEAVTITPRNYPLKFRFAPEIVYRYATIGMATVVEEFPLYYDGTNEFGLSAAGLNFPGNAYYGIRENKKYTVASFEFIPWVLCQCKTVKESIDLLQNTQLSDEAFSADYPSTDLHWIISDKTQSIVVEPGKNGLEIIQNPFHILTNNPPFAFHANNIQNYQNLSNHPPENGLLSDIQFHPYSNGLGSWGLPGDTSSASRFVRAFFTAKYSVRPAETYAAVTQFFHILGSVRQTEGCTAEPGGFTKTVYTSCCDTICGKYYYTTYENSQIRCVQMNDENKCAGNLEIYPLDKNNAILMVN